jgi:hypothetical protein
MKNEITLQYFAIGRRREKIITKTVWQIRKF